MNLPLSPLQLVHYHLKGISVVALEHPSIKVAPDELYPAMQSDDVNFDLTLSHPPDEENPKQFMVGLTISSPETPREALPYNFGAHIEGLFKIDSDDDLDKRKQLVVINGAAMLYGVLREQILSLTMRQINGPMMLPSLNTRGLAPSGHPTAAEPPKLRKPRTSDTPLRKTKT